VVNSLFPLVPVVPEIRAMFFFGQVMQIMVLVVASVLLSEAEQEAVED
jgi:hypothetical protein